MRLWHSFLYEYIYQNYPWKSLKSLPAQHEMYDGETYRLYTDNQDLRFAGYMMTAYQRLDTSFPLSASSTNIGYGSKYYIT